MAKMVTGSVAEIMAPKTRQSAKVKYSLMDRNMDMMTYMKPLESSKTVDGQAVRWSR